MLHWFFSSSGFMGAAASEFKTSFNAYVVYLIKLNEREKKTLFYAKISLIPYLEF